MPTIRLIPSSYTLSNTSYLTITNPNNLYANTDSTSYATIQNKQTGTTSYYIYIRGFNFSSIPSDAIINSFTIKLKAYESGVSTSTSYRPVICNNTTTLTCSSDVLTTSAKTITFTGVTATWEQIVSYGSNFGIRVTNRRNSRNTTSYVYIYGAEILVDYTLPVYHTITTQATDCTATPSGNSTVMEGEAFTVRIDSDSKPKVTDNGIDVSSQLVEKQDSLSYTVQNATGTSYGFALNSDGYYESNNQKKASSTALCIVNMSLPVECTVTFTVINYAESTYDYGLLSNVDKTLSTSASADTSNVYWNGKQYNSASPRDVTYTIPAGEHFIYVKYFKDSYTDSNSDSLQFKVNITPNVSYTGTVYYEYVISNVTGDHLIVATKTTTTRLLLKNNNQWNVEVKTVYKKVNGTWVKQDDWSKVFMSSVNYVKGN